MFKHVSKPIDGIIHMGKDHVVNSVNWTKARIGRHVLCLQPLHRGPLAPIRREVRGSWGKGFKGGEAKNLGFSNMNKENMQLLSAWEDKEDGIG